LEFPPTAMTGREEPDPAPAGDQAEFLSRLDLAGLDTGQYLAGRLDPWESWQRLRARFGRRATLLYLYRLTAQAERIPLDQLDGGLRRALAERALALQFPGFERSTAEPRPLDPVEVVAYDPDWPRRFSEWEARLVESLGPAAQRIDHIGSTSVPGLAAKPVIDVEVSVANLGAEAAYVPAVESLGVLLGARDDWHRFFRPGPPQPRDVQVHVVASGGAFERDHLLFRDYLRAQPEACLVYAVLKRKLAARWRDDRYAYVEAKTNFILDTLERAEVWAASEGWASGTQRAGAVPPPDQVTSP
jgi:GrpB-like predicted nucleotidyltransferase (UPF0157 family)